MRGITALAILALATGASAQEPDPDRLEVRVRDRATRQVVPDCELRWLPWEELDALERAEGREAPELLRALGLLREHGRQAQTDPAGRGWLPIPFGEGSFVVGAYAGELLATTFVRASALGPVRLELEPERTLAVVVVDAHGEPVAGVPVALRRGSASPAKSALTDATGRARLRHLQALHGWDPDDPEWTVGLGLVTREEQRRPLAPALEAGAEVRLTLPATGSVELLALGPDGAPLALDGDFALFADAGARSRGMVTVELRGGRAVLPHVELGLSLRAFGRVASALGLERLEPVPTRAGERVTITLHPDLRPLTVEGRVFAPDGAPLAEAELELFGVRGSGSLSSLSPPLRTDASGRFRKTLHPLSDTADLQQLVLLHASEQGLLELSVDRPPVDDRQHLDLGHRRLERPPVVARGRVVDERGRPVAGAELLLHQRYRLERTRGTRQLPASRTRSDAQGRFELRAFPAASADEGTRIATARARGLLPEQVELEPGDGELELVLHRPVRVEGSLAIERLPRTRGLRLALERADESGVEATAEVRPDGTFVLEDVRAGSYELAITLDRRERLARVPVEVPRVDTARPEALAGVALPHDWRAIAVEVVDARGRPIEAGTLTLVPEGERRHRRETRDLTGAPLAFELLEPGVRLNVCAPGFRPVRLDGVAADTRVVLYEPLRVRVWLGGGLEPPPPPARLRVALAPAGRAPELPDCPSDHGCRFDQGRPVPIELAGQADLRLPSAGTWTPGWFLEAEAGGRRLRLESAQASVEVTARAEGLQELDLWPEPESLARALRSLDEARDR